jgi:hypothetical protein
MSPPRLTSDFFVAAFIRRVAAAGDIAMLRRRGAAEAGAVFVVVDRLDGTADLFVPAAQTLFDDRPTDRLFEKRLSAVPRPDLEARLAREISFDPDCFIIEVESRRGESHLGAQLAP